MTLTQAVLLALLPLLCCFVRCALDGETISSVWLPAGRWSDEFFYYKQVEGIIQYGYPQGYFGFNESRALNLSYAMQSPVLVFPWVIWGLLFGWNLWSPVVCNIVLTSLVCFLFVCLVKPAWKQLGVLALLFSLYLPATRYMLSGMAEILCFDMVILFYGLAVNYLNRKRAGKLVLLFALGSVMTLMRPWMLPVLLLPSWLWIRRIGWRGTLGSAAVLGASLGSSICVRHYIGTEYYTPPYGADWAAAFSGPGVLGGARICIALILCILVGQSILDWRKFKILDKASEDSIVRDEENVAARRRLYNRLVIQLHLALSFVAVLAALFLRNRPEEGGRQLLTLMMAGIFVIALMETKYLVKVVLLSVSFAWLCSHMAVVPLYHELPYRQAEKAEQLAEWEELFDIKLELQRESNVPNYDNSVIWVLQDETSEEGAGHAAWQLLYALPEGFGISCCTPEYVADNFEGLKSGYLAALPGSRIDEMCIGAGCREIGRDEELVIYRLR